MESSPLIIGFNNLEVKVPISDTVQESAPLNEPIMTMTEDEIRSLPLVNGKGKKVFNKSSVKKMVFNKIVPSNCYKYVLESFIETRKVNEIHEPYIYNPQNQVLSQEPPPYSSDIWAITVLPDMGFKKQIKKYEIPGSSRVQRCHDCNAVGIILCQPCSGSGRTPCKDCKSTGRKPTPILKCPACRGAVKINDCMHCNGKGVEACNFCHGNGENCIHCWHLGYEECFFCNSRGDLSCQHSNPCHACKSQGYKNCKVCNGLGKKTCQTCAGYGNLRFYNQLMVDFDVVKSDHYHQNVDIPVEKLKQTTGQVIFHADAYQLIQPITTFHTEAINKISKILWAEHVQKNFQLKGRILKQRHNITAIPVIKVDYEKGSESLCFWIYGNERFCHSEHGNNGCCCIT